MAEDEEQEEDPHGVSESESALRNSWRLTSWLFSSSESWSFRSDCLGRESGAGAECLTGEDGER